MRALVPITILLLLAATGYLVYETREIAALAGRHERSARAAQAEAAGLQAEHEASAAKLRGLTRAQEASAAEITRLEGELARTASQLGAMADAVQQAKDAAAARVAAAWDADRLALAAMPEGVRQCLAALHAGLLAEGYSSVRFLRAQALDDDGLHDVEVVHTHADGLGTDLIVAKRMTVALDRKERRLVLTFFEGIRRQGRQSMELPEKGWNIIFAPVDGRLLEQRLPYLIRAKGVYPGLAPDPKTALATDVDVTTRMAWLERFDRLLEVAGTSEQIEVQRFRGMAGATFLEAQLLATDEKDRVEFGAACKEFAVEVDRSAKVVSLVLRDGLLRRGRAESTITDVGYRILLPKVTPEQAIEIMLGLVVYK